MQAARYYSWEEFDLTYFWYRRHGKRDRGKKMGVQEGDKIMVGGRPQLQVAVRAAEEMRKGGA